MGLPFSGPRGLFSAVAQPGTSGEPRRIERVLASVRLVLAASALAAIYIDPTEPARFARLAYTLLVIYVVWAAVISLALRRTATAATPRITLVIHGIDILFPTIIGLFTHGPDSPFFLFFGFVLLAAAYRWGLNKTLLTGLATTAVLVVEALLLSYGPIAHLGDSDYDLNRVIIRAAYLAIFAFLIGYLAEQEKRLRAQALMLARVSSRARFEAGLKGTIRAVLQELLALFQAQQVLLIIEEGGTTYLWRFAPQQLDDAKVFTWCEVNADEVEDYFFPLPCDTLRLNFLPDRYEAEFDNDSPSVTCAVPQKFVSEHPFRAALINSYAFEQNISSRLFLLEPHSGMGTRAEVSFLRELARHVGPAIYNVYLLRRLRAQAAADERARVARDLHDGVLQSLHAIGLRLYTLRVKSQKAAGESADELLQIQRLVQQAGADLRQLMQQLKPIDLNPNQLVESLSAMVERFRHDTGIEAKFFSDLPELKLPRQTAQEVAYITREALVNVARHSGAGHVVVRLSPSKDGYKLVIDDDGCGFDFIGRFSQPELESSRRGPMVIKERVRAIGGELTVESGPGRGARLEILFPHTRAAVHA
jgi:signal transduction histidine kinase